MKTSERRLQCLCLASAAYCTWGIIDLVSRFGLSRPKALTGCLIGALTFVICGLAIPQKNQLRDDKPSPVVKKESNRVAKSSQSGET